MALPAVDDFERASLGSNWTVIEGSALEIFGSSDLGTPNGGAQESYWNADTFDPDQYCEAVLSASGGEWMVGVRISSPGYNAYHWASDGGGWNAIEKLVGGAWSNLGNTPSPHPATGDTMRVEARGQTISAYLNGAFKIAYQDAALTTGSPGLGFYNGNSGARFESFTAGNLPDIVTHVGAGTAAFTATNGATLAPGLPTGWAADDIHILVGVRSDNTAGTTPSGWTPIAALTGNNTTAHRVEVYWRRAVAGDTAPTYTFGSGTTVRGARIYGFRGGATSGDPFDTGTGAPTRANTASGSTTSFTNLTTTIYGAAVLAVSTFEDDPSGVTTMSGYTQPTGALADSSLGTDTAVAYQYREMGAAGSAGATSVTWSGGSFAGPSTGILIAIVPPSAAGPIAATISATGAGTTSVAARVRHAATGAHTGAASTSVTARQRQRNTGTFAGAAATSFTARIRYRSTGNLTGAASTSFSVSTRVAAAGAFAGAGSTSVAARFRWPVPITATGSGLTYFQKIRGASSPDATFDSMPTVAYAASGPASTSLTALVRLRTTGSLTGAGTTSVTARIRLRATGSLTGASSVSFTALARLRATGALTGPASTSLTARSRNPAAFAAAGPSSTSFTATYTPPETTGAAGSLTGAGSVNVASRIRWRSTYLPTGVGATSFAANVRGASSGVLTGAGSVAFAARIRRSGAGALTGDATTSVSAWVRHRATGGLSGPASTSFAVRVRIPTTETAAGAGATSLTARQRQRNAGALTGVGAVSFAATYRPPAGQATGNLLGAATTAIAVRVRHRATGAFAGTATTAFATGSYRRATGEMVGGAATVATVRVRAPGVGALTGAGATSFTARIRYRVSPTALGGSLTSLNATGGIRPTGQIAGGSATLFAASVRGLIAGQPGDVRTGSGRQRFRVRVGADQQPVFATGSGTPRGGT